MHREDLDTVPWYRQPWVWFIIALPATSVVLGIALVVTAVKHKDDLVRDDWYKAGRAINQDLQAEMRARELGLSGELVLEPAVPAVRIRLTGNVTPGQQLKLALVHSTIAAEDMTVVLEQVGNGEWYGVLPALPMGKRHLMLETVDDVARWRLRAGDVIFQGLPVALQPTG